MSNTNYGQHVLDQPPRCSSPPADSSAEKLAAKDRNNICVDGSHDTSPSCAPDPPDQNVDDDAKTYPEGGLRAWLVVLGSFSGMVSRHRSLLFPIEQC